ncbi:hypothetical protein PIB30_057352 [Stylosanthes scabra]|uniref:Uncharacterized protein n=1 Tax=Stylosanthes scabra TaxID=79078 RepID=A0ABU6WJI7_9FABA|nr:hypothetical protein [Stylosanthes scabra]
MGETNPKSQMTTLVRRKLAQPTPCSHRSAPSCWTFMRTESDRLEELCLVLPASKMDPRISGSVAWSGGKPLHSETSSSNKLSQTSDCQSHSSD